MPRKTIFLLITATLALLFGADLFAEDPGNKVTNAKAYSLSELYRLAGDRSEKIGISEEDLYMARLTRKKAFSVLVPRITAFADHKYMKYDDRYRTVPPNAFSDYDITQRSDTDSWGVRIDQSFTLNGKELTALRISGDMISKSEYDLKAVKEKYFFQVAAAYYGILRAAKAVEISRANVMRLETHRNAVSIRLRLGEVTKTALYRTEAELSGSNSAFVLAENSMRSAKAVLAILVELPDDFSVQEPGTDHPSVPVAPLDRIKKEALENRAELKALNLAKKISEDTVTLQKGAYWPTVSLYGIYADSETSTTDKKNPMDIEAGTESYTLGISFDMTIFDNGLRKAEVSEARSKERQALLALDALSKQVRLEVEQAYLDLITKKSIITSLEDQLAFSRENYEAVTKQFEHGLSNSVDVMDANTLLVTSQRQLSEARYSYRLAALKLERTKGSFLNAVLLDE
ncbi:TolC family protein [Thermodesulfobacteriota bacterium]